MPRPGASAQVWPGLTPCPIPNSRFVQLIGRNVQFVGHIRLSATIGIAALRDGGCVGNFLTTTVSFSVKLTSARRQDLALDVADQLGYVVVEIEVMTGENPRGELRCRALRPGHHLLVRGDFVVIA